MNPSGKFHMRHLAIGLLIALAQFVGPAMNNVTAGTLPKDPCALLTAAEIQTAVAPNGKIGNGVPAKDMLPLGVNCTYTWGPRTKEWGESALSITVIDASKAWPGRGSDVIEEGLLLKAKTGAPNAAVISGVGDAAVFTYAAGSFNGVAEAYFKAKDVHLSVQFHEGDALQNKEKLIALLKQASAKL